MKKLEMSLVKKCGFCGKTKPKSEFSLNNTRPSGLQGRCKTCFTESYAIWRTKNRERYNQKQYAHMRKFPERTKARGVVRHAIQSGALVKKPCEECGEIKVHAHHEDYSQPLLVNWLCIKHHEEIHHK